MSARMGAKFRCAPLRVKKTLGIFRELNKEEEQQRETRVAFGTRLSGPKKIKLFISHRIVPCHIAWMLCDYSDL